VVPGGPFNRAAGYWNHRESTSRNVFLSADWFKNRRPVSTLTPTAYDHFRTGPLEDDMLKVGGIKQEKKWGGSPFGIEGAAGNNPQVS